MRFACGAVSLKDGHRYVHRYVLLVRYPVTMVFAIIYSQQFPTELGTVSYLVTPLLWDFPIGITHIWDKKSRIGISIPIY